MNPPAARVHLARVLAVAAVTVTTLAVAGITIVSVDGSEDGSYAINGASAEAPDCTPGAEKAVESGYYVLKEGESLSNVADKTCVDVDRIERLSPNLDPMALPPRGCVDLVKDGCKVLAAQS
jgi:hypothetical protein